MVILADSRPVLSARIWPLLLTTTGSARWIAVVELLLYGIVVGPQIESEVRHADLAVRQDRRRGACYKSGAHHE